MNIIKRFLNVVTLFGALVVLGSIYEYLFDAQFSTDGLAVSGVTFGFVLFFNYILFQNVSLWNKLEKKVN